jgi:GT2 family glycosyltransferase
LIEGNEPIRVIRNEQNLGYLLAANQGWKTVNTPFCLHLNNDVSLEPNCINNLMNTFNLLDEKIGIVGAVQYYLNGARNPPLSFFYRGNADIGNVYKKEIESEETPFVEADIGGGFGCAVIKKEVWQQVGYYSEEFAPCHYEQEDFCLKAKEAGWKIGCAPSAHCTHYVAQTTGFNLEYYTQICNRNREIFRAKWEGKLREFKV